MRKEFNMGTNFYLKYGNIDHVGKQREVHIGKDSFGWKFTFEVQTELEINSFDSLKDFFMKTSDTIIIDEYEREYFWENFCEVVNETMHLNGVDSVKEDGACSYYDNHGYVWYNREFT